MIKRLKIYKMATSILLKFLTLKWNISRTIWRIEVGDGSLFCIFHALSFEFNLFFDRRFPLIIIGFSKGFRTTDHSFMINSNVNKLVKKKQQ